MVNFKFVSKIAPGLRLTVGICAFILALLVYWRSKDFYRNSQPIKPDQSTNAQILEKTLTASQIIEEIRHSNYTRIESGKLLAVAHTQLNEVAELLGHHQSYTSQSKLASNKQIKEVCPESFQHNEKSQDIYFRRGGFKLQKCTDVPEFHTLLTLVYNFVHYDSKYFQHIPSIFHDVNKLYPNIRIIAAIPDMLTLNQADYKDTTIIQLKKSEAESSIWRNLIDRVQTKYVYIGRNVIKFTWFDRLERLVREIGNLEASVVSGAYRTLVSGVWSNGCEQSTLSNYQLVYRHGYVISMEECLVCHHVQGPFVAKKSLFQEVAVKAGVSSTSAFAIWFLKLKNLDKTVVSCPDAMAIVTDESQQLESTHRQWRDLAFHLQVERIRMNSSYVLEYGCKDAGTTCSTKGIRQVGKALSKCCMKELSNDIKVVMRTCRENGMLCQLNAGTNLGAIKFNSVLPWELDADISVHHSNLTAFDKLKSNFLAKNSGFTWKSYQGHVNLFSSNWKVEVYPHVLVNLSLPNLSRTIIEFDGEYVETALSPGLFGRNLYGKEIYQHVQHWSVIAKKDAWDIYSGHVKQFPRCSTPGHHACLDKFKPDGNLIFKEPIL